MGQDTYAYSGLKKLDTVFDRGGEPIDPITRKPLLDVVMFDLFDNEEYPGLAGDIEYESVYSYEKYFSVHPGSYGTYDMFREMIAKLCEYGLDSYIFGEGLIRPSFRATVYKIEGGPFYELLVSQDSRCVFGATACSNIAKSFSEYQEKQNLIDGEWIKEFYSKLFPRVETEKGTDFLLQRFRQNYSDFRKAFEIGADRGAVQLT